MRPLGENYSSVLDCRKVNDENYINNESQIEIQCLNFFFLSTICNQPSDPQYEFYQLHQVIGCKTPKGTRGFQPGVRRRLHF